MIRLRDVRKTEEPEDAVEPRQAPRWWATKVSGFPLWGWLAVTLAVLVVVLGAGAWWTYGRGGRVPPVTGLYRGEEITFIHTEASDAEVADTLTGMKASPVLVVPELADVPAGARATVYVFTNGVEGGGPFGFQPDVFDSAPGDDGYRPLREVNLVTWEDGSDPRVLKAAADVRRAAQEGQIRIEKSGVVVNMPFLTWPGGQR